MKPNDAKYFPLNYANSRERIQKSFQTTTSPKEVEQWSIPSKTDSDLAVDFAYWPALESANTVIVLTSGIHGSETYAGSAIQQMFLEEIFPRVDLRTTGIVVVHGLNPYGFKHHQRTTEQGVNLNRNFSISGELYKTVNTASAEFHKEFYSREKVKSAQSLLFERLHFKNGKPFFEEHTLDEIIKAVAPGQFERAEDLEFGGTRLEPQSKMLAEKMHQILPRYKDVLAFDLHTGLGDQNRLHLLTSGSGEDLHPELFDRLFHTTEDQDIYSHTPASAEGFYKVNGALNSLFVDLSETDQRVCAITMEFGTMGHSLEAQLEGFNSFIVQHQGQYYGFESKDLEQQVNHDNFLRAYPQSDEWRNAVVGASRELFSRILKRI